MIRSSVAIYGSCKTFLNKKKIVGVILYVKSTSSDEYNHIFYKM